MITVRPPRDSDAHALSRLLSELGYPLEPNEIPARLAALRNDARAIVWIAELGGRIAGVATAHLFPAIHATQPVAWLTALVVSEDARGSGVGKFLVARAEEWAREHGAVKLALTSALHRDSAHAFYESLGYTRTGVRLAKELR